MIVITWGEKITLTELINLRNDWRYHGETMVWTNGCFDLLHTGHINYLRQAKALGDILVVGINSDKSMEKIKRKPINKGLDRAKVLSALRTVDYVVIFDELEPSKMVELLGPDIVLKAGDWKGKKVPEKKVVEDYGGKFIFLPYTKGYSTTETIKRCKRG